MYTNININNNHSNIRILYMGFGRCIEIRGEWGE